MSKEREAFEAWAKRPPFEFDLTINGNSSAWPGNYRDYHVQCAWVAWEERSSSVYLIDKRK